jgi:hypothetical protein
MFENIFYGTALFFTDLSENVHLETESMFLIRAANTGTASVLIIANL